MSILDDFKLRFPSFDTASVDAVLPALIDTYKCYYGKSYNGCSKEATLQLLAHLYVLDIDDDISPTRSVASQTVKSVSVSYEASGSLTTNSVFFNSTKYGQRFLMLTESCVGAFFV